jgi:hypothetical protein
VIWKNSLRPRMRRQAQEVRWWIRCTATTKAPRDAGKAHAHQMSTAGWAVNDATRIGAKQVGRRRGAAAALNRAQTIRSPLAQEKDRAR